ncbi:MAG: hypothetical protein WKG01_24885 [Kofleriaceae bacterium]
MIKHLATIWHAIDRERGRARPAVRRRKQRGVALVIVLICIAVTLTLTSQFGTSTNVDMIQSANYRDQMRAHFLARSSLNLSELVIRLQQRIDNIKELRGSVQITDFADQVMLAFCGTPEEVNAAVGLTSADASGLGADIGTCGVVGQISTEDDKLNVNCLNGNDATAATFKSALDALVFFNAYDPVFEEGDAEGWRRDRAQQVAAMTDYIDSLTLKLRERGTTEDYGYESLKDPYKAKNNYIDSVGELKLAKGVDDRFWSLFGSSFTAYGSCKVNLSALTNSQLIAAVLYLSAKNPQDPVLTDPRKLFALAGFIARSKQFGQQFTTVDDFVEFVKAPTQGIAALAGKGGMAGSAASAAVGAGLPGAADVVGMELDKTKLGQMAVAGPRRTYRVQAWGEIERKQKKQDGTPVFPAIRSTLTGVWDTKVVIQNVRKPPAPKGAWVFLREE